MTTFPPLPVRDGSWTIPPFILSSVSKGSSALHVWVDFSMQSWKVAWRMRGRRCRLRDRAQPLQYTYDLSSIPTV